MLCLACRDADRAQRRVDRLAPAWASIPARFREADRWSWPKARAAIVSGEKHGTTNVVLHGDAGAGKTSMACAILATILRAAERSDDWATVEEAATCRYTTDALLTQAVATHPLGKGDAPAYLEAVRAHVLVLDELGYDLLDRRHVAKDLLFARYDAGRRTIITTGQKPAAFASEWGSGAARRIWDEGAGVALAKGK